MGGTVILDVMHEASKEVYKICTWSGLSSAVAAGKLGSIKSLLIDDLWVVVLDWVNRHWNSFAVVVQVMWLELSEELPRVEEGSHKGFVPGAFGFWIFGV